MPQENQTNRRLEWAGCYNARDLGGCPTVDGEQTRRGVLVRSDTLHDLTDEGQAALCDYGVRTVIDIRLAHELERDPSPFATRQELGNAPRYLKLPIYELADDADIDAAGSHQGEYIVILEKGKDRIASIIKAVAAGLEDGAVLVHCQGGKDRTGIIVALLLSLAGVEREAILEDYALSETMLEPFYLEWVEEQMKATGKHPGKPRYMQSRPETMAAVLDYLEQEYGGVEGYLQAAGVTRDEMAQIRSHLVTPSGTAANT